MTFVLGVSGLYHDAAAALVKDGEVVAAAQEERFTRRKHDPSYPANAIDFCLGRLPDPAALDAIVFYEDPVLSFDRVLKSTIELAPRTEAIWPAAARSQIGRKLEVGAALRRHLADAKRDNVYFVDHHVSHAASAFYVSPFESAAILVVDGIGEWASTSIGIGRAAALELVEQIRFPHSLGLLYSAFTHHCGLKVNSGEYKLMGLAPYGEPRYVDRILDELIDLRGDGSYQLNTRYFGYLDSDAATSNAFAELFDCPRREPETPISLQYMDIAASAQAVLETAMTRLARRALAVAGTDRLCMAGGVALNCVANGRLVEGIPELRELWIQPASGDAGGALGAALHVAHRRFGAPRHASRSAGRDGQKGSLLGPAFDDDAIREALDAEGLVYETFGDNAGFDEVVADALAAGQVVGRFDGAMEFGPRALGNRSIIADPRRPDGQTYINLKIKFRESWRPFAPIVLAEHADGYFDLKGESPYMLVVGSVKPDRRLPVDWAAFRSGDSDMFKVLNQKRSDLPSITHVDYSARVQTVDAGRFPRLHALMSAFHRKTGCPVLVNTSFNVRGEPIVCTPQDAIRCFVNTGIDILAIGRFLVRKADQSEAIKALEGSMQFELD